MIFIEAGNTMVKAVSVDSGMMNEIFRVETNQPNRLRNEMRSMPVGESILLSSVRKDVTDIIHEFQDKVNIQHITYKNLGTVTLDYKTPETIGIDRVLACLGAVLDAGGGDVIVIDAGTACTIDYMTGNYTFMGGVIMPGLAVSRKGMQQVLTELPETEHAVPEQFPGRSTEESLRWGVYGGFIYAIYSFIEKFQQQNRSAKLYIAGGDGEKIAKDLNNQFGIQSTLKRNLVFEGMKAYLDLNRDEEC